MLDLRAFIDHVYFVKLSQSWLKVLGCLLACENDRLLGFFRFWGERGQALVDRCQFHLQQLFVWWLNTRWQYLKLILYLLFGIRLWCQSVNKYLAEFQNRFHRCLLRLWEACRLHFIQVWILLCSIRQSGCELIRVRLLQWQEHRAFCGLMNSIVVADGGVLQAWCFDHWLEAVEAVSDGPWIYWMLDCLASVRGRACVSVTFYRVVLRHLLARELACWFDSMCLRDVVDQGVEGNWCHGGFAFFNLLRVFSFLSCLRVLFALFEVVYSIADDIADRLLCAWNQCLTSLTQELRDLLRWLIFGFWVWPHFLHSDFWLNYILEIVRLLARHFDRRHCLVALDVSRWFKWTYWVLILINAFDT